MMMLKRQQGGRNVNSIVYGEDERLLEWACGIIHFTPRADATAIGWEENGILRAVTIYDGFSQCDCNMHIASDGTGHWLRRAFLKASFGHPFLQWNMRRVTGLVPAKNAAALRFDLHLGFKQEGLIRHALPDDDIIVLGMLREDCRWTQSHYRR